MIKKPEKITKKMDTVERKYAKRSGSIFAEARRRSLELGHSVLTVIGDQIVRISPDGRRQIVKQIGPPRKVKRGTKIVLR